MHFNTIWFSLSLAKSFMSSFTGNFEHQPLFHWGRDVLEVDPHGTLLGPDTGPPYMSLVTDLAIRGPTDIELRSVIIGPTDIALRSDIIGPTDVAVIVKGITDVAVFTNAIQRPATPFWLIIPGYFSRCTTDDLKPDPTFDVYSVLGSFALAVTQALALTISFPPLFLLIQLIRCGFNPSPLSRITFLQALEYMLDACLGTVSG